MALLPPFQAKALYLPLQKTLAKQNFVDDERGLGGLFGRAMSQIRGWDKFHSLQTTYPPQTAQHESREWVMYSIEQCCRFNFY